VWIEILANLCGISDGQSDNGTGFPRVLRLPPPNITPPMLRSHLCIYHRHYVILANDIDAKQNKKKDNARPTVEGMESLIYGLDTFSDSHNIKVKYRNFV
jgi:hypothetical protein